MHIERGPDQFFTAEQHNRMRDLMDRRASLKPDERSELENLIDAELEATILRTNALISTDPPNLPHT